jgi:hypothetical protein
MTVPRVNSLEATEAPKAQSERVVASMSMPGATIIRFLRMVVDGRPLRVGFG